MKAWSASLWRAILARQASVSSTDDNFRSASWAARSTTSRAVGSFELVIGGLPVLFVVPPLQAGKDADHLFHRSLASGRPYYARAGSDTSTPASSIVRVTE